MTTKNYIPLQLQMDIATFLKDPQVLKVVSVEDKLCEYVAGWNDEKVALHFHRGNTPVTANNVSGIRKKLYGQIVAPARPSIDELQSQLDLVRDELSPRIEKLEGQMADVVKWMQKMELSLHFKVK